MRPADLARAALLPVTELSVLLFLLLFALLGSVGIYGGLFGLFLLALMLPPIFRFQMLVLEATAKGKKPEPLDAENFSVAGSAWALFPLPLVIVVGWAAYTTWQRFGDAAAVIVLLVAVSVLPSSLAVLAITRSPLQSINPVALVRLFRAAGSSFWIASVYLFVTTWLCLQLGALPLPVEIFLQLALMFSFFSVTGALIEPYGLMDDVYIPVAVEPGEEKIRGDIEKHRIAALGHAYGFISRENRKGGFDHIVAEIERDPDPAGAWAWYFDRMLGWENQQHALFFAQHYIHDALRHGERVAALKAIMRCLLIDERFRPFPDDLPAAIAAAEASANTELAAVLKRG
jgi:hypothetical protein